MQYEGKKRTFDELVKKFRTEIYEKQGKLRDDQSVKYFECLKLIADLKVSFQFYYDYEDLRAVLQDYINVLSQQLGENKFHVFTPTDIAPYSNLVFNTPSTNRTRFGEVQLHTSVLTKSELFDDFDEDDEQYDIKFELKNYTIDNDLTMYNFQNSPFIGLLFFEITLNYYFVNLHSINYFNYRYKSDHFKLFHLYENHKGYTMGESKMSFNKKYAQDINQYFKKNTNCFTLLPTYIPAHFVACLIHKTVNEINIYIIDSNGEESQPCYLLIENLKTHFSTNQGIPCIGHYLVDHKENLNFGSDDLYQIAGYCVLVGHMFMDILYRNIVFHNKLRFNAESSEVIDLIKNMKKYCVKNFYKSISNNLKWKIICFNFSYRFMKSTGIFNTNPNEPLNGEYYVKKSVDEIKNIGRNYQNTQFTFKSRMRENFVLWGYNRFIGINWQTDPDYTRVSQNNNDYFYFVVEDHEKYRDTLDCFFSGINTNYIFQIRNDYESAKINSTDIRLNKIHFLFQNMRKLTSKIQQEQQTPLYLYVNLDKDPELEQERERRRKKKNEKKEEDDIKQRKEDDDIKQRRKQRWKPEPKTNEEIEKEKKDKKEAAERNYAELEKIWERERLEAEQKKQNEEDEIKKMRVRRKKDIEEKRQRDEEKKEKERIKREEQEKIWREEQDKMKMRRKKDIEEKRQRDEEKKEKERIKREEQEKIWREEQDKMRRTKEIEEKRQRDEETKNQRERKIKERQEQEEKERQEQEEKERQEQEEKERQEQEEKERQEQEESERQEQEEKERQEQEESERQEQRKKDRKIKEREREEQENRDRAKTPAQKKGPLPAQKKGPPPAQKKGPPPMKAPPAPQYIDRKPLRPAEPKPLSAQPKSAASISVPKSTLRYPGLSEEELKLMLSRIREPIHHIHDDSNEI